MLTEVTFMHQRAFIFGAYWSTQTAISSLLNTASSYEATITWRWYYVSKFRTMYYLFRVDIKSLELSPLLNYVFQNSNSF
jgi:hypothetical protein